METDYNDEVFALPVSGHYDCGYSYGGSPDKLQQTATPAPQLFKPASPVHERRASYLTNEPRQSSISRPRSPPTVLPNSFVTPRSETSTPTSALISPNGTTHSQIDLRPAVVPKPWTLSKPTSPTSIPYSSQCNSESDLSTLSTRSRQTSTQSAETADSSFSLPADNPIKPDPLPSHSNPQWLSPTQSAAFSGPRPIQPLQLGRRRICDANSGDVLYQLSDETKLKLSKQAIYRVFEPNSSSTVGTIAYPLDSRVDVAAILRGKDIVMKKESSSSHRWSFKPAILTKRGALWYWSKDKLRGDVILSDSKKGGVVVARIQKDVLSFERAGLGQDTINEISFSAMALAEMARRSSTYEDAPNLAAAIAIVALGEAVEDRNSDDTVEATSKPRRKLTLSLR